MLLLRIYSPKNLTPAVKTILSQEPTVSALAVMEGASVVPPGDLVMADIPREIANDIVDRLMETGLHEEGSIQIEPVRTWVSRPGLEAERAAPGMSADAVVWADVVRRAYEESELTFAYVAFMTMATEIASVGIILDSQILIIGAMVLGPEFGPIAGLGVALVRRRFRLFSYALRSLVLGFLIAIAITTAFVLVGRWLGWVSAEDITGSRPRTAFIYKPDHWSVVVALIAGAAGVLAMTSAKTGGMAGVFISVATVPAAGNIAAGLALGVGHEIWGSARQLLVNITCMALAGCLTLLVEDVIWGRVRKKYRRRRAPAC